MEAGAGEWGAMAVVCGAGPGAGVMGVNAGARVTTEALAWAAAGTDVAAGGVSVAAGVVAGLGGEAMRAAMLNVLSVAAS
ncbi:hypothetical protein [Actinoplanes sp. NPDC049265]|uniref:hypothetical protein n=1 Tax=Actinoplanes sp. NPDC049265 TaxID=3363902 RepID=UPI0037144C1F